MYMYMYILQVLAESWYMYEYAHQCGCENKWVGSSSLEGLISSNLLPSFITKDKS